MFVSAIDDHGTNAFQEDGFRIKPYRIFRTDTKGIVSTVVLCCNITIRFFDIFLVMDIESISSSACLYICCHFSNIRAGLRIFIIWFSNQLSILGWCRIAYLCPLDHS